MTETFMILLSLFATTCTIAGFMAGCGAALLFGAWVVDLGVTRALRVARLVGVVIEYAVYRRRFRAWLREQNTCD